jgi:hypothetical protein
MTTHRNTPIRRITHKRRRSGIRTWIMAFLRGKADEDTTITQIEAASKRGAK